MAEKGQFRAIKGVRDILPPDSSLWNWFEATARRIFETYGYREIRLPIFEQTELFARSVGPDTDIVSKEMYSFDVYASHEILHWRHEMVYSIENPIRFTGCLYELLRTLQDAWD